MFQKVYDGDHVTLSVNEDHLTVQIKPSPLDEVPSFVGISREVVKSILPFLYGWCKDAEAVKCERFIFGASLPFTEGGKKGPLDYEDNQWWCDTVNGRKEVRNGDWIVRTADGRFYVNTIL
jgi:hypothetical protein